MSDQEINEGGPAFPSQELTSDGMPYYLNPGMTLRDYFAAKAMQGIVSCPEWQEFIGTSKGASAWSDSVAEVAYTLADSMLKVGARRNPLAP